MKRRVVNTTTSSRTVVRDTQKKKKKKKGPKRSRIRLSKNRSRTQTPVSVLSPIRTPPSFASTPRRAYSSTGSVDLILPETPPSGRVFHRGLIRGFSPIRRSPGSASSRSGSSTPRRLKQKRVRPGRGPTKRAANRKAEKKPLDKKAKYVLGTLARYHREFPPTRPRSSTPRLSPSIRARKSHAKKMSNLLHYVEPRMLSA